MKIYTKGGDEGKTSLIGNERVSKCDPRVEAYGSVDELTAHIALLDDMIAGRDADEYRADLTEIENGLMYVQSMLAVGKGADVKATYPLGEQVVWLEKRIDEITGILQPIFRFTIPGGDIALSQAHICRTVCRRAERRTVEAAEQYEISADLLKYLNRLSDYLYVLGRGLGEKWKIKEKIWQP